MFVMATIKFHTRKNLRSVVIFVAFTNVASQFVYLSTRLHGVHQIQNSLASLISSVLCGLYNSTRSVAAGDFRNLEAIFQLMILEIFGGQKDACLGARLETS